MSTKKAWSVVVFLVVFLPSALWAQGMMHGKWWHDKTIINNLDLSDAEKRELDEKYIESRRRMITLKGEIEKQRFELDLLLGTEGTDRQQIMDRFASLEEARASLSRERFAMLLEIRDTIGAERFQELKLMYRDRDRKYAGRSWRERSYERGRD